MFVISRPSHLSTFFSYLVFFPLLSCLCSFFILPASHHHWPLSAQFFSLFSAIHIDPSASLSMTQWISVVPISVQHVALTHRPEEWVQFISQINAFHAATCLPSCILSSALPLLQFVLLKDKQPQNWIGFPCAVS